MICHIDQALIGNQWLVASLHSEKECLDSPPVLFIKWLRVLDLTGTCFTGMLGLYFFSQLALAAYLLVWVKQGGDMWPLYLWVEEIQEMLPLTVSDCYYCHL